MAQHFPEDRNYYNEYVSACQEIANLREALAQERKLRIKLETRVSEIRSLTDYD